MNETAFFLMKSMNLSEKILQNLRENISKNRMNRTEMDMFLNTLFPDPTRYQTSRHIILESTAIAAYRELPYALELLLTDDAPQYNLLTPYHPLCWVHDARHYKKLTPVFSHHIKKWNHFREHYWDYYDTLLHYKNFPTKAAAEFLTQKFDDLFATRTGYNKLDERIEKTRSHKEQLLLVLKYPMIPLHNNASELGAREQARRRDINLHTISKEGTEAKDTFMTLTQTAKKLTVNFYHYVYDRIVKKYEMPSLANIIAERSQALQYNC
jgi:hypothetical protein